MLLAIPSAVFIIVLKNAFTKKAAPCCLATVTTAPIATHPEKEKNISIILLFLYNMPLRYRSKIPSTIKTINKRRCCNCRGL